MIAGLEKDLYVFYEKPPGMNVEEIKEVIEIENKHPDLKLKYRFNHRYHDSEKKALRIIHAEKWGQIINLPSCYISPVRLHSKEMF